jgi:transcriptional regulator with XRE-family HTH domain
MTEPGRASVGPRVVAARRRAGLSREELAFRSGLSWPAIAQIESGRRASPRAETLSALAGALGVTTDFLLGRDDVHSLLRHHALLYAGVDDFVATAAPLVAEGVDSGEAALVVTTPRNADALRDRLGEAAGSVRFAVSDDWYSSPRAALARYREFVVQSLAAGASWVRVVGEPPWSADSGEAISRWSRYESFINLAFAARPVTLACPYDESSLAPEIVARARATHCTTLVHGETEPSETYQDPTEFCLDE